MKYQSGNIRKLTVSSQYNKNERAPYIRLRGNWLKNAGFEIGDTCYVFVKNKRLIIANENNASGGMISETGDWKYGESREYLTYTANQIQKQLNSYTKAVKELAAKMEPMLEAVNTIKKMQ